MSCCLFRAQRLRHHQEAVAGRTDPWRKDIGLIKGAYACHISHALRVSIDMLLLELMAVAMLMVLAVATNTSETHTPKVANGTMVCAYPISGQYGTLSRLLYYALMVFACPSQKWRWPSIAALAYIMNYAATAAVHAFLILVTSDTGAIDLDIFGASAILSAATFAIYPTLGLSSILNSSVYRPLFGIWGSFISLGACFCMIQLLRLSNASLEPPCVSRLAHNTSDLLIHPSQLLGSQNFNCTYACFERHQAMRGKNEVVALAGTRLLLDGGFISWIYSSVMGFGVTMGIFACGVAAQRKRTRTELHEFLSRETQTIRYEPGDYDIEQMRLEERKAAKKELETGEHSSPKNFLTYFNIPMAVVVVILIEVYINFKAKLPVSEKAYAVGQWMPLVTIALAFAAAAINSAYQPEWEKLQKTYQADKQARVVEQEARSRTCITGSQSAIAARSGALPHTADDGVV